MIAITNMWYRLHLNNVEDLAATVNERWQGLFIFWLTRVLPTLNQIKQSFMIGCFCSEPSLVIGSIKFVTLVDFFTTPMPVRDGFILKFSKTKSRDQTCLLEVQKYCHVFAQKGIGEKLSWIRIRDIRRIRCDALPLESLPLDKVVWSTNLEPPEWHYKKTQLHRGYNVILWTQLNRKCLKTSV